MIQVKSAHCEQDFLLSQSYQESFAAETSKCVCDRERVTRYIKPKLLSLSFNPFPHTTILQQTILNIFCKKMKMSIIEWITYD